jgi:hypothetical protein
MKYTSDKLTSMVAQIILERALTSMLADNMKGQGEAFFDALEKSGQLDPEQLDDIRQEWQTLIQKRISETEGAAEGLKELVGELRETFKGGRSK